MPLTRRQVLTRVLPFLEWFSLAPETLRHDAIAGLTVAMVLVPQAMAYAQLAGLPPVHGLYAALLPPIVGALWGSSRHLATGPVALTSLLTVTALAGAGFAPDAPHFAAAAALLALMAGGMLLALGLLRLAFVVNFVSHPVVQGFTNAAALLIAFSQVDALLGVRTGSDANFFDKLGRLAAALPHAHAATVAVGAGSLAVLLACRRLAPRLPAALIAAALATAATYLLPRLLGEGALAAALAGLVRVGDVPRGLPVPAWPPGGFDMAARLLPPALLVTVVGFMEVASVTKAIATRSRQRLDLNRELVGQGLASVAAGLTQGFPVSGSFSRTALAYASGARTGLASVVAGLSVLATLLWLTPLLRGLPQATLAAIIILAVTHLVDVPAMLQAWRAHPHDGIASLATFVLTLYLAPHLVHGILAGSTLALALYLYRTMSPRVVVLGPHPDGTLRDARAHGLAVDAAYPTIRFDGRLYFANAAAFEEAVLAVRNEFPEARYILVQGDSINELDASGDYLLRHLAPRLREGGVTLVFVELKLQVTQVMARTGLDRVIGPENFFRTHTAAREALARRAAGRG